VTTFVLNGVIVDPDGSSTGFHVMAHAVFDPEGNPRIEFDNAHCQ
jgi:hypothetical protein